MRWWIDFDDETLINALDGDEDEAYELKLMFTELYAECERILLKTDPFPYLLTNDL